MRITITVPRGASVGSTLAVSGGGHEAGAQVFRVDETPTHQVIVLDIPDESEVAKAWAERAKLGNSDLFSVGFRSLEP